MMMPDDDFGEVRIPSRFDDLPEPSDGFESVARVADQAMFEVQQEDWVLRKFLSWRR